MSFSFASKASQMIPNCSLRLPFLPSSSVLPVSFAFLMRALNGVPPPGDIRRRLGAGLAGTAGPPELDAVEAAILKIDLDEVRSRVLSLSFCPS